MKDRKIDVEESKRLGGIITKEIDENDSDYGKHHKATEHTDRLRAVDEYIDRNLNEYEGFLSVGIEIYYLYLFIVFFAIPMSFALLSVRMLFLGFKELPSLQIIIDCGIIAIYSAFVFIMPFIVLRRKDVSLYHKKIVRIIVGNNIVLLIWLCVVIMTSIIFGIEMPVDKTKLAFILYYLLAIFDIVSQMLIASAKEKYPSKTKLLERISVVLSAATIWGYGAIICPLVFSKRIERIIFDIALLVFVVFLSVINLIAYKANKKKVKEDYKYNSTDMRKGRKSLIKLICGGVIAGLGYIILIMLI